MSSARDIADNLAAIGDYGLFTLAWRYISALKGSKVDGIIEECEKFYEQRKEREGQLMTKLTEQDIELFEETVKLLDGVLTEMFHEIVENLAGSLAEPEPEGHGLTIINGGLSGSIEKN